jgi:plasmid stabilization system protein ParE
MRAKFQVRITNAAEVDIEEIWDFIAQDNPAEAGKFLLRLEDQVRTLQYSPGRCPLISENEILGAQYRHLMYGNYRTVFRVSGKTVYVLRVIHGARLLDMSMFEEAD